MSTDQEQTQRIADIAAEAFTLLGAGRTVSTFSSRYPEFTLAEAYGVAAEVRARRMKRGEKPIGRKIGFTNRAVWSGYGISGPIWNYMFDSTVHLLSGNESVFVLGNMPEPRIEPEIVFHLARAPHAGMSDHELLGCIGWVAHGFEIVFSIFPGWMFTAADAVAAYGVHGALLIGKRHIIGDDVEQWAEALASFKIDLVGGDGTRKPGHARNVLGGPIKALGFLVAELARDPVSEPLAAGEIVTTGTLTEAMPMAPGQVWTTAVDGIAIEGLKLTVR